MRVSFAFTFVLAVWCGSSTALADVRLQRFFGDHMVLQQETGNTIWGWAEPGEKITVTGSWGASDSTAADSSGRWKTLLATPSHGTGHTITVSGKETTIKIADVAIGEVWICLG